ncbi:GDSL-like Lipase/Acylhydrolase family protein [Streptomyces sp. SceaMP-e96]|uniref:SGNH/GDSL hydrolase family protein n=1 Tax=unclassified Streptomyces TaxID=2593676 RepID=UPI00082384C1|nr:MULTISPECIES: SGNH/GDSL hydrolase family protein [unclassified Streptomyces]SCK37565.1 GDSL-like Lipase/Acylhydrolase family protein [Streptomyces sp. SceaMP-e96]
MSRYGMPALSRLAVAAVASLAVVASAFAPAASGAPARSADRPEYVALGDSYSAGVFVRPWEEHDGCGRSGRNYPHQVAGQLGFELTDVTCGAAEVVDGVLAPQPASKIYGPPTIPPPGGWSDLPPQVNALSPDTDYVTVGIGGNSLGFGAIVKKCLELGVTKPLQLRPCTNHYSNGGAGEDWLEQQFTQLDTDLARMMTVIHRRAPHARVAVVGYPAIVPDNTGCNFWHWNQLGTVKKGDMPWLDGLELRLNALLEKHAAYHAASYVDTYGPSAAHGVCESGDAKWMYGIKDNLTGDGGQTDPPNEQCRSLPGAGEACTFVHPNARGLDNQTRQVSRALMTP